MAATAYEPAVLPAPQTPASAQPGGYGPFVRLELLWGRVRRAILRTFFPGHVRRWQALQQGTCAEHGRDVIDPRDVKFIRNACGITFRPEDDTYAKRFDAGFARYGWAELVGFSAIWLTLAGVGAWLAWAVHPLNGLFFVAGAVLWLHVLWFFRDPARVAPVGDDLLISPADGTVTHVGVVDHADFPGGRAMRVSIFLSVFSVHGNRTPCAMTVEKLQYYPGAYLDARHPDCMVRNEQLWVDGRDRAGRLVRVIQISGAIARRIVCWVRPGEQLPAGGRYGMIKFGSRTELLVAADAAMTVKVGDKVLGGLTVLGRAVTS